MHRDSARVIERRALTLTSLQALGVSSVAVVDYSDFISKSSHQVDLP